MTLCAVTNDHMLITQNAATTDHVLMQYYDDTAGILRSVILSAIVPHRMSASPMPQAFTQQDSAAGPIVLPMTSPLEEPMFSAFEDEVEDS